MWIGLRVIPAAPLQRSKLKLSPNSLASQRDPMPLPYPVVLTFFPSFNFPAVFRQNSGPKLTD